MLPKKWFVIFLCSIFSRVAILHYSDILRIPSSYDLPQMDMKINPTRVFQKKYFLLYKRFFSAFFLQFLSSWDAFINKKLIPVLVCWRRFFLCRVWRNYWIILENHSNHFERTCHCRPHLLTIFSVFWELLGLSVRRFYSTHAKIWLGFCGFGW